MYMYILMHFGKTVSVYQNSRLHGKNTMQVLHVPKIVAHKLLNKEVGEYFGQWPYSEHGRVCDWFPGFYVFVAVRLGEDLFPVLDHRYRHAGVLVPPTSFKGGP